MADTAQQIAQRIRDRLEQPGNGGIALDLIDTVLDECVRMVEHGGQHYPVGAQLLRRLESRLPDSPNPA